MTLRCRCSRASSLHGGVVPAENDYCPPVKSSLFSPVPAASFTSTCQAPVHSAGTVLRLQVRQGDPPTCNSTSPTCVSPWNHTWWTLAPPAPSSLTQQINCATSAGNTVPVSCGCRSSTDRATTASTTVTDGVAAAGAAGAGGGGGGGGAGLVGGPAGGAPPRGGGPAGGIFPRLLKAPPLERGPF